MRKITLRADWYLKAVLTIIAVALCLICLNPWIAPKDAGATNGIVPVRIEGIGLYAGTTHPLPVQVTNWP